MKTVHSPGREGRYPCEYCDLTFPFAYNLRLHTKSDHLAEIEQDKLKRKLKREQKKLKNEKNEEKPNIEKKEEKPEEEEEEEREFYCEECVYKTNKEVKLGAVF